MHIFLISIFSRLLMFAATCSTLVSKIKLCEIFKMVEAIIIDPRLKGSFTKCRPTVNQPDNATR